jgi:hypothetical protein
MTANEPDQMPKQPPNIVDIRADGMGYGDMTCSNPGSKTPQS